MELDNAVAVVGDVKFDLALARAPKQVLAEAQDAAKALQSVISTRKNAVKFNGKHYLSFEDWQTCGRFYGVTAKIVSTEPCEMDGVKGFIAKAEAINTQNGQVISAAESMCMNDEPNWAKKPLFQLRSMAQTRACAKSLRNCLAWVVVLAGYEPSVAEEMTGDETAPVREPIKPPVAKVSPAASEVFGKQAGAQGGRVISDAQRKRFYAIWKGAGKDPEAVKAYLMEQIGSADSASIPADKYEALCDWAAKP
jgi:hypothetical protein